ncbi:hypothetical protein ACWDUD_25020 [Rhodococcus sp. NPDC003382]
MDGFEALWPLLLAGLTAAGSGLFGMVASQISRRLRKSEPGHEPEPPTLDDKMRELAVNIASSRRLMAEVNLELDAQVAAAQKLKLEAEHAEVLAALNKKERDAVAALIREEIREEGEERDKKQMKANAFFFIAGFLLSSTVSIVLFILS